VSQRRRSIRLGEVVLEVGEATVGCGWRAHTRVANNGEGLAMSGLPGVDRGNRGSRKSWWVCLVAALVLGALSAAMSGCASAPTKKQSAVASETTSVETTAASTFDAQAIANLTGAEFETAWGTLTTEQRAEVSAILATRVPEPAPVVTPVAKKVYRKLSSRAFKQVAKDPDSYIGKTYYVYGEITQFDSATGVDTFRADLGYKKLRISYGFVNYSQNAILTGTESRLKKYVEGDCFTAKVTVLGSYSYDTQIGGNTTVPSFQVDSISRYGSTD
jgi:hypothetical protein